MSGYEVLPVMRYKIGGDEPGCALEWVTPRVMALHRMLHLTDTHVQASRLRDVLCTLQLPGVTVKATCAELEAPKELEALAGRYLVMTAASRVTLIVPRRVFFGVAAFEVSVLAICRLPPPCFEPRAS